jgi:steroid 5-alpha reductase family enzyme
MSHGVLYCFKYCLTALFVEIAPLNVRLFIGIFSSIWFLRLSLHLFRRYLAEHEEDRRYANMRRAMGKYQHLGFFAFFMFQAGLAILFSFRCGACSMCQACLGA